MTAPHKLLVMFDTRLHAEFIILKHTRAITLVFIITMSQRISCLLLQIS